MVPHNLPHLSLVKTYGHLLGTHHEPSLVSYISCRSAAHSPFLPPQQPLDPPDSISSPSPLHNEDNFYLSFRPLSAFSLQETQSQRALFRRSPLNSSQEGVGNNYLMFSERL